MITRKNLIERTHLPDHTFRVLRWHISSHLSLLQTKAIAPNPRSDSQNGPQCLSSCIPFHFCSLGLEAWTWTLERMNPLEYWHWAWAPGCLISIPWTDLQQLKNFCKILMTSLCYSMLPLNNWMDWWCSLNSQSHCACIPGFIFLSSGLKKPNCWSWSDKSAFQYLLLPPCSAINHIQYIFYSASLWLSFTHCTKHSVAGENTCMYLNTNNCKILVFRVFCCISILSGVLKFLWR